MYVIAMLGYACHIRFYASHSNKELCSSHCDIWKCLSQCDVTLHCQALLRHIETLGSMHHIATRGYVRHIATFGNVCHTLTSEYARISHCGAMVRHIVMTSLCAYQCDVRKFVALSQRKEFCNIMRYEHEHRISKWVMFITLQRQKIFISLQCRVMFVTL